MLAGLCAVMLFSSCESDYKKMGYMAPLDLIKMPPVGIVLFLVVLSVQFASRVIGNRARD